MDFSHPFGISVSQIIIDRNDMNAASGQRIQICRQSGYQRLTFTSLHLRDTSLVKNNSTNQLYPVMFHPQHTLCCLAYGGKCFRKEGIQRLTFLITFFVFFCLCTKLLICELLHLGAQRLDLIYDRRDSLQLSGAVGAEKLFRYFHVYTLLNLLCSVFYMPYYFTTF